MEIRLREIKTDIIIKEVKKMCIEANLELSQDVKTAIHNARDNETNELGYKILTHLVYNIEKT